MLNIRGVGLLARLLGTNPRNLSALAESGPNYYEDLVLIDPAKPGKTREVLNVTGPLRRVQESLHRRLLAPNHKPSYYSHGGVRGRSIKTNVDQHVDSIFLKTSDIANFYPSVHYTRVYELFVDRFGCSPDVARICTKLCTYRHHLAQGLITSPILADCLMNSADRRIGIMCSRNGLVFTRYVDDITLSGSYPIVSGSFPKLVKEIIGSCGFKLNTSKDDDGRLSDGKCITRLRINRGRIDIRPDYLTGIHLQITNAGILAEGGECAGHYYTPGQIRGRIHFVGWINPNRKSDLMKRYRSVPWRKVEEEALRRGFVAARKMLVKASAAGATEAV